MAPTHEAAEKVFDLFVMTYTANYPKAAETLSKDRERLQTFHDFPDEYGRVLAVPAHQQPATIDK